MNQYQLTNDVSLNQQIQTTVKSKRKRKYEKCNKCNECNKRKILDKSLQICSVCFKAKTLFNPSGNETVDDFIKYTQINLGNKAKKMEFVSYDQFKDVKFVAEGGFGTVYIKLLGLMVRLLVGPVIEKNIRGLLLINMLLLRNLTILKT